MQSSTKKHVITLAAGVLLGAASTTLAGLWEKAELEHAANVRRDRSRRMEDNQRSASKTKDPDLRRLAERKAAIFKRSLELVGQYEAAIKTNERPKAKKLREAIHLLRLQAEGLNQAIELRTSILAYKLTPKPIREAVTPGLEDAAAAVENNTKAFDAGIAKLSQ